MNSDVYLGRKTRLTRSLDDSPRTSEPWVSPLQRLSNIAVITYHFPTFAQYYHTGNEFSVEEKLKVAEWQNLNLVQIKHLSISVTAAYIGLIIRTNSSFWPHGALKITGYDYGYHFSH